MSIIASVTLANSTAANKTLADAGYGDEQFSMPARRAGFKTDATRVYLSHLADDPAYEALVKTLPSVQFTQFAFNDRTAEPVLAALAAQNLEALSKETADAEGRVQAVALHDKAIAFKPRDAKATKITRT